GDADLEMQMLEGFRLYPMMVDLRFHRWETLLETPEPARSRPFSHAFWRYARAIALAAKGDVRAAAAEQRRFARERGDLPEESMYLLTNKAADLLALAAATLDAQLAAARGETAASIDAWRRAVTLEQAVQYDEPPAWLYTVRQSLGVAQLAAGNAAEAEQT